MITKILLFGLLIIGMGSVQASENQVIKTALVIGNRAYIHTQPLANPENDGHLIARSLKQLGFSVTEKYNLDLNGMTTAVRDYSDQIPAGSTAVVYFAGHGMQIQGNNYLIPVDMPLIDEQQAQIRAYPLRRMLDSLANSKSAVNILILDACRNNPFHPLERPRYRGMDPVGLAHIYAPRGTLVAYSTAPGQQALDGKQQDSLYSAALAKHLVEPGRTLEDVFKVTTTDVRKQTLDEQIPWYESSLTDVYYLSPPPGVTVVAGKFLDGSANATGRNAQLARPPQAMLDPTREWYRQMDILEWNRVDWAIQQRVKGFSADELVDQEKKAKGGNVIAQTTLGLVYREGLQRANVESTGATIRYGGSNPKALRWLTMAATAGFPVAQAELGEMYYTGKGINRDLHKSRHWLELAAAAEYPRAKLDLLQLEVETGQIDDPASRANMTEKATEAFSAILKSYVPPKR